MYGFLDLLSLSMTDFFIELNSKFLKIYHYSIDIVMENNNDQIGIFIIGKS